MVTNLLIKPIIDESDLESLIGLPSETDWLDVKEFSYTAKQKDWQVDLCTDVAAFANLDGGIIVLGMTQTNGVIDDICGLPTIPNLDSHMLQLGQVVDRWISPLIPGVRFQSVALPARNNPPAIVIQVPRSFTAPHRVELSKLFKIRRSNRNDDMSMDELRRSFNFAQTYIDAIRAFRRERIAAISGNDHQVLSESTALRAKLILHVVPLAFSDPRATLDLTTTFSDRTRPRWVIDRALSGKYNFDGFMLTSGRDGDYRQIYRSGAVEYVQSTITQVVEGQNTIDLGVIESITLGFMSEIMYILPNLGVQPPLSIMLTLSQVTGIGFTGGVFRPDIWDVKKGSERSILPMPEILLNDYEENFADTLKPAFDVLWNVAGYARSPYYDDAGHRKPTG